jgi:N-acyl-D-amino-acid deacylase
VLIEDGLIRDVGSIPVSVEARRLDCHGLVVAPGFVDVHSHSDLQVLEDRTEKLAQGVVAEVVGNCGFSAFPAGRTGTGCMSSPTGFSTAAASTGAGRMREVTFPRRVRGAAWACIRWWATVRCASPMWARPRGRWLPTDLAAMERTLEACLDEGAAGFSTGLMYAPGSSAPFEELERLCRVVARKDKLYASHIRSYFSAIPDAIDEQLELARRTGCRLQISHLQIAGRRNWHLQDAVIGRIERAAAEGIDIAFDCYPYTAGSTVLTQLLPQWALEGGAAALLRRLADPEQRARIADATVAALEWSWDDIFISSVASPRNAGATGKNLAQLAAARGARPIDAALDLLLEEDGAVNMLCFNQSEQNLRATLSHPLASIISDGFYVDGRPHPRLFGTFPRFLGSYVRDHGLMELEEGVRKMTGAPAQRFGMADRGIIAPGKRADVVVFDAGRSAAARTTRIRAGRRRESARCSSTAVRLSRLEPCGIFSG